VRIARETVETFAESLVVAVPRVTTGVVFLAVAYVVIRVLLAVVRSVLEGVYPESQHLVARLWVTVVGLFLWFGAALVLLNLVGLGEVAASLGISAGFLALGVA
jgi:hypothetical protein